MLFQGAVLDLKPEQACVFEQFSSQESMLPPMGLILGSFLKVYQNTVKYFLFVLPVKT